MLKRGSEDLQHSTSLVRNRTLFGKSSNSREIEVNMAGATKLREVWGLQQSWY